MNVIPKKRAQQFVQNLTLARNLSFSRSVSALRNAALPIEGTALRSVDLMRQMVSRIPRPHRTMKIPKLHGIPNVPLTSVVSYRFAWFSASLAMYGWFMYWIACDIFVLHKPITLVSPTNYLGALVSMTLIWGGTTIFKPSASPVLQLVTKPRETFEAKAPRKRRTRQPKLTASTSMQLEPLPPVQPNLAPKLDLKPEPPTIKKPRKRKAAVVAATSKCEHRIENSLGIPDGCLTCTELITCLSAVGKKRSIVG